MSTRGSTRAAAIVLLVGGLALIGAAIAGVRYTSQPAFCASCHEMRSLHREWRKGAHARTDCYDCHVDNTIGGHVMAKVNGLRQVYSHFATDVDMSKVNAEVPSHRCVRCHDMAREDKLGPRITTAHRKHIEAKLACTVCHLTLGHSRELFTGFNHASCKECHSTPAGTPRDAYLRRLPCTRE